MHMVVGRDNLQWHPRGPRGVGQLDFVRLQVPSRIHGETNRVDRLQRNDAHAAPPKVLAEAEA
jgi:hypothetical protein